MKALFIILLGFIVITTKIGLEVGIVVGLGAYFWKKRVK